MKRLRHGFTIIEVAIFLAVTGLLFISVTVGVQNSIFQQRYTDSVQSFADFLRNVYSEVANVQSLSGGRSDKAIYGKLITFGESTSLNNEDLDGRTIFVYDVVAQADSSASGKAFEILKRLGADVVLENEKGDYEPVGIIEEYRPRWVAAIQPTTSDTQNYKGTIIIVRHPSSGRVYTAELKDVAIEVNDKIKNRTVGSDLKVLNDYLWNGESSEFKIGEINFCVNPNGNESSRIRANVRINEGASNASGVEVIMDGEDNKCKPEEG